MSSVPTREALRFLERSVLVERTPHLGSHVAEMSERDLEEIYTIRLELESMAVRLASKRIIEDDRARLHDLLDRYVEAARENSPAVWDRHADIHMALYDLVLWPVPLAMVRASKRRHLARTQDEGALGPCV